MSDAITHSRLPPSWTPARSPWNAARASRALATGIVAASFCMFVSTVGAAQEVRRTIRLVAASGEAVEIGHVLLTPDGDRMRIAVKLDGKDFKDEFLSMRPFRCLTRPRQMWCHLAYPYVIADRIGGNDLQDLEYRLLFLWRPFDKVGIDAWNGLYFKLAPAADGSISGALHEADFNILAAPPDANTTRPIMHDDLSAAQSGQHEFDRIEIR